MVTLGTKPEELRVTYTDDQQKAITSADKPSAQVSLSIPTAYLNFNLTLKIQYFFEDPL